MFEDGGPYGDPEAADPIQLRPSGPLQTTLVDAVGPREPER